MSSQELHNKVFFITGGAQGFGKVLMEAVLQRGAKVYFIDIQIEMGKKTLQEFQERFGEINVAFCQADVAKRSDLEDAFKEAIQTFEYIDVLLNNAAIVDENNTKRVADVNFLGVVQATEIASELMRKDRRGRGGRIVAMSSIAGLHYYYQLPVYNATKHAIRVYSKALAQNPTNETTGLEFACFHPDASTIGIFSNLDGRGIHQAKVEAVIDAFLELVTLKTVNGATLFVGKNKKVYVEVESREISGNFPSVPIN